MKKRLEGKRVAILVADGFEQVELTKPKRALEEAGAAAKIISPVPHLRSSHRSRCSNNQSNISGSA